MRKYLNHMHQRPTHERRLHAMRVAGVLTALVFVGWVTTLSLRVGTAGMQVADINADTTQTAAVGNSGFTGNQLIVSTTTDY